MKKHRTLGDIAGPTIPDDEPPWIQSLMRQRAERRARLIHRLALRNFIATLPRPPRA